MPAKIVVLKDNQPIREYVLIKESTVVGRKNECDITISDTSVSGVHARILRRGDQYQIKDLSSTNGIHVGGRRIHQHTLKSEDMVLLGEHQLQFLEGEFVDDAATASKQVTAEKTAPVPPKTRTDRTAHLMVLTGKDKGQQIDLDEPLTSIGVPGVQVAAVSVRRLGHYIVHVDGGKDRNRVPHVNGEAIGFTSRKLEHGDQIEVADVAMEYVLSDVTVIRVR